MRRGDRRFIAVHGIATSYPGVSDELAQSRGYRVLRETSDFVEDESCEKYQEQAVLFAEAYNTKVMLLTGN